MNNRLEHAKRNHLLSEKLYQEGEFLDWANTTAFYAALHYVQSKLLPNVYNGVYCESIDNVYIALNTKGKHEATCELVKVGLPSIAEKYSYLMNCSFTARYKSYIVHKEQAKLCQKFLSCIKDECDNEL
ncbi:hypothetical protein [Myroides profundi]|uniref:HEPN domain-containing protein n=1 Tax=Myroides profundi TaxID=480520 RepID=A0AAJ4W301_MYRPR|nr:hypothetical protein [Myroides profundi]AJH16407.1 hypothetical protein MPR_3287 [Myroides profundi]SEQ56246.1 hypothetical protein SAMN04488089_10468 [Myroides profundi]